MSSVHELMTGLLDYIIEQAKAVDPRAFTLARATEFQRTPSALRLPGVTLNAQRSDDAVWLRVERLNAIRGPVAPELLAGLLTIAETPEAAEPSLQQVAVDARVKTHQAPMEERERIARAFDDHLRAWRLWSATEKPRRASMRLYADLFAMKHQIETEETAKPMELVWGIGVSSWQIPYGEEKAAFHYPLLTQAMEIGVDKLTMALEVQARDVAPKAEFEAVVACGISGASEIERSIRETVNRQPERLSPFDPGSYEALLKTAACTLHAEGRYVPGKDGAESCPPAGPELVITDDWVLFARPRSNSFLLDDIRRLREKVSPDIELPEGPKSLVSAPTNEVVEHLALNFRGLSSHGGGGRAGPARELFFPLPYNDEQVAIVEKLEQSSGVAVQGPPGTGKTHTIANVICHYLATGRRVLVTSRGEPALEVLQDKIPAEVRPLTVALLSGDRSGTRQFQSSIEAIQHRVSQLNPHTARAHIDQLESNIDALHGEIEAIDARVGAIAQAHLDDLVVDGVKQKAHKAADLVVHGKSLHGWFDDALTLAPEQAPPLGEEDAERIRSARRRLGDDLVYLHARLPQVEALPSIEEAKRLHELLMALAQADDAAQAAPAYALKLATPEVLVAAEALVAQLDAAGELLRDIERDAAPWGMQLRQRCREASYATERAALESVFKELDGLVAARAAFLR